MPRQSPVTDRDSRLAADKRNPAKTVRVSLSEAIAHLEREHTPSAPLAAELLLMHVLGRDRTWIYAHPEQELTPSERERYAQLIDRRASGAPTQHLTGHQEFWGLDFEVTPDVLIPRPETEHVIEVVLERLGISAGADSPRRKEQFEIADVGTGSGCIAIALAHELPAAQITATDISPRALEVAHRNATRHNVADRIKFVQGNMLDGVFHQSPVAGHQSRVLDVIASNPPYIALRDAATLPCEVREHEPATALFGGETGTELYAPLIAQAAVALKPNGFLVLELGWDSAGEVLRLLQGPEWERVMVTKDLAGIDRVVSAQRATSAE